MVRWGTRNLLDILLTSLPINSHQLSDVSEDLFLTQSADVLTCYNPCHYHDISLRPKQVSVVLIVIFWAGGLAQWWERSPPTTVARVRFPDSASYVGWVGCWFSTLLWEVFLKVLQFSPLLKSQHFWTQIHSGLMLSTLSRAPVSGDCASTPSVWR